MIGIDNLNLSVFAKFPFICNVSTSCSKSRQHCTIISLHQDVVYRYLICYAIENCDNIKMSWVWGLSNGLKSVIWRAMKRGESREDCIRQRRYLYLLWLIRQIRWKIWWEKCKVKSTDGSSDNADTTIDQKNTDISYGRQSATDLTTSERGYPPVSGLRSEE